MNQRGFALPSVTSMLGALCVVLFAATFILHQLWRGVQNDFAKFRAAVELAQKQAEAEAAWRQAEQERVSRETAEGWAAAVDWYRQHPRIVRVREPDGCPGQVPTATAGSETLDGGTVDQGFNPVALTASECERRLNDAIHDAAQLMWLQAWVREQGFAPSGISSTLIEKSGEPGGAPIKENGNAE